MTRSTEFDAAVKRGIRVRQPDLVVHLRSASDDIEGVAPHVGLIVAKSVGSAVERHRVARRLRHVSRAVVDELHHGDQVVIRALPSSRTVSSARLDQQLRRALELAGTRL